MNILIICQYFYPENFRINDIASEWVRRGHKVNVITGIPNYPEGSFYKGYSLFTKRNEEYNGVVIHRIPIIPRGHSKIGMVLNYLSFLISGLMWANTTHLRSDVVFSFETSPMTQVLVGTRYCMRTHTRHIVYVQDLWPENVEEVGGVHSPMIIRPLDHMVKKIYRNADLILATSPSFVEMIRNRMRTDKRIIGGVDENKVRYWPQYAEDFYQPVVNDILSEDESFRIVFTGNIGYAQGLDVLPACAKLLCEKGFGHKIHFVLVGDGRAKPDLLEMIDRFGVADLFDFLGRKSPEEIPKILSTCDVAFLSFTDNKLFGATIPAKLQSYMACAMPILAAATGETRKIIEDSGCGICTTPGDENAIADEIIGLLSFTSLQLKTMSENSLNYSRKHFDRIALMDMMESFLTDE